MNLTIKPCKLAGRVDIPASKSIVHRNIICASLSNAMCQFRNVTFSKDIHATIGAIEAFGNRCDTGKDYVRVNPARQRPASAVVDCVESGSTLRFLIPVAAALGIETTFKGQGRLPERPITPYLRELSKKGVTFDYQNTMPFTIKGQLQSGIFELEGDISSQFITGLLLALPILEGDSEIRLTSPLQSKPYVDLTLQCMRYARVEITETPDGYDIPGGQQYNELFMMPEGDFSQAAFFFVANFLGNDVALSNVPENSVQGDRKIVDILADMGKCPADGTFYIDASDIPDLVPILAVAASFAPGPTRITGAERLRIKESDRLETTADLLNSLGGKVTVHPDGLEIHPVKALHGGTVDSAGDHRIAMCAAIASTRATGPVTILGAECVEKSYPAFFEDFQALGGALNVVGME